jgi:Zinc finger, C3HC4 type (RING finger)
LRKQKFSECSFESTSAFAEKKKKKNQPRQMAAVDALRMSQSLTPPRDPFGDSHWNVETKSTTRVSRETIRGAQQQPPSAAPATRYQRLREERSKRQRRSNSMVAYNDSDDDDWDEDEDEEYAYSSSVQLTVSEGKRERMRYASLFDDFDDDDGDDLFAPSRTRTRTTSATRSASLFDDDVDVDLFAPLDDIPPPPPPPPMPSQTAPAVPAHVRWSTLLREIHATRQAEAAPNVHVPPPPPPPRPLAAARASQSPPPPMRHGFRRERVPRTRGTRQNDVAVHNFMGTGEHARFVDEIRVGMPLRDTRAAPPPDQQQQQQRPIETSLMANLSEALRRRRGSIRRPTATSSAASASPPLPPRVPMPTVATPTTVTTTTCMRTRTTRTTTESSELRVAQRRSAELERELAILSGDDLSSLNLRQVEQLEVRNREAAAKMAKRRAYLASSERDAQLCVICLDAPRTIAFSCGHFVCCSACSDRVYQCPLCRRRITQRLAIFFNGRD